MIPQYSHHSSIPAVRTLISITDIAERHQFTQYIYPELTMTCHELLSTTQSTDHGPEWNSQTLHQLQR
jgi:hypothetical protein